VRIEILELVEVVDRALFQAVAQVVMMVQVDLVAVAVVEPAHLSRIL
tara:strand:- start:260 stop:400 length:141 start_codon:yes stop_codon:yes gene_type:complete